MLSALFLIGGLVALYWGAEWLVEGASEIASHLKLSKSFIGLTLVAFGTSAPEFFVNLIAALHDEPDLALSNVAGSNLTNLCLGFGISSLLVLVPVRRSEFLTDLVFMALAPGLVVGSFLWTGGLSPWALVPFGGLLAIYLISLSRRRTAEEAEDPTHIHLRKPLLLFAIGMAALYLGGEAVFRSTLKLAQQWDVPETIIGLTVVACGTSIPDVTASISAARKGEFGIAVGNLLGSNISNVFVVLGGTLLAAQSPLPADALLQNDYLVVLGLSVIVAVTAAVTQRIPRLFGIGLLLVFTAYLTVRVLITLVNTDAARIAV